MTNTIQGLLMQAETLNDVPIKTINGLIAATPAPITTPSGKLTLRGAIKNATQTSGDALSHIKQVRKEHSNTLDTARAMIAKAEQRALDYLALAAFIDRKSDNLPSTLGATQVEAAIAIRSAREAGLEVSPAITSEIEELCRVAHARIKHSTVLHNRRAAAWRLALHKRCVAVYSEFASLRTEKAALYARAAQRYGISLKRAEIQYDIALKAFKREAGKND